MKNLSTSSTRQIVNHKVGTQSSPLVEVSKTFAAPVEKVFEAWHNENLIRQWWGPENFTCPFAQLEFSEGGRYLFAMQSMEEEDKILWSTGTFEEIIPNKKIVLSDAPSDEHGNVISPEQAGFSGPWPDFGVSYITVDFEAVGDDRCRVWLSHSGLPSRMHDECVDGWSSSLEKIRPLVKAQSY